MASNDQKTGSGGLGGIGDKLSSVTGTSSGSEDDQSYLSKGKTCVWGSCATR